MQDQVFRRRAGSWDGSSVRPNSSRDQQHRHNQQQDQQHRSPGVYLRGLPKDTPAEELQELFAEYGVSSVQVVATPHYSTITAFVNFRSERAAQQVLSDYAHQDLYVGDSVVEIRPKHMPGKQQQQQQQQQHGTISTASKGRHETSRPPRHSSSSSSSGSRIGAAATAASTADAADAADVRASSIDPCNAAAASPVAWHDSSSSSRLSSNHSPRRNSGEWQAAAAAVAAAAASIASPTTAPAAVTTPSIVCEATMPRAASPATSMAVAAAAVAGGQLSHRAAAVSLLPSTTVCLGCAESIWLPQPENEQQPAATAAAADGSLVELDSVGLGNMDPNQWRQQQQQQQQQEQQQQQQEADNNQPSPAAAAAPLVFPPPLIGPSAAPWPIFSSSNSTYSTSSTTHPNSSGSRDEHARLRLAHLQQPLFDQDFNFNDTSPAAAAAAAADPSQHTPQQTNMYMRPPHRPQEDLALRQGTHPAAVAAAAAADPSQHPPQHPNMYVQPPDIQGNPSPQAFMLPTPVLAPVGVQHVLPVGMQHVLPFGTQHMLPPPPGFPPLPMQRPLVAPSPIYAAAAPPPLVSAAAAAGPTYGDCAPAADAAAYGTPAGYSSAYAADAALHSSSVSALQSAGGDGGYSNWHTPWLNAQHEAQQQAQHNAAALCEAFVVFQQLEELQLLHEKLSHCLLCLQKPRSAVLLPCKHLAVCNDCCRQLTAGEKADVCPLCGAQVLDSIEGVMLPT